MSDFNYEGARRIRYEDGATFVPVCRGPDGNAGCGRFVKADGRIMVSESTGLADQPNATCKHCGRVHMAFEGFFDDEEM